MFTALNKNIAVLSSLIKLRDNKEKVLLMLTQIVKRGGYLEKKDEVKIKLAFKYIVNLPYVSGTGL